MRLDEFLLEEADHVSELELGGLPLKDEEFAANSLESRRAPPGSEPGPPPEELVLGALISMPENASSRGGSVASEIVSRRR